MIRIYEKSDSQFNNLAAAWSKMTRYDKSLFKPSFIILASDHQEEEVEKIAAALNIDFIEKFFINNTLSYSLFN
ncbi:hypothetical protein [Bacillus spizizenii]|uniref:Uncharacterized protein n=1 Tax=Bacillus spizizenii (strain DSM 15029 / JCM 12233 / NBRC 101239 / NRRL B-23049 / TU-B-10) TaxID=1052585 RepID=G4NT36_BACS4|nr:hypothetical protein [Bacillus spizizenii]AEP84949.1 hypothetical protein GYO_0207 [Bacillus spizizenii TU-B-10]AEP85018.1 hypothetical protein GYO_0286 [Bacillus spizizenii TU-B-10]GEK27430.1 hypothetical protein BSU04nite_38190 [Bacillus spizizenii]